MTDALMARSEFDQVLDSMRGMTLWGVGASPATGSYFTVEIGPERLTPPDRRGIQRQRGVMSLFVKCAWRLEKDGRVICSSRDDPHNDGPLIAGLKGAENHVIRQVEATNRGLDLLLELDNGLRLLLFCDASPTTIGADSYAIYSADRVLSVYHGGVVHAQMIDEHPLPKEPS